MAKMMPISVHFIVVALAIAHGQLTIKPKIFGGSLNLTCTFDTNYKYTMSLVISKSENGANEILASVNKFKEIKSQLPGDVTVTGFINNNQSGLSVLWTNANCTVDGNYTCTAVTLDQNDLPVVLTTELDLTLRDLDPSISVTPTHIQAGLTPSLIVECSLINASCYDMDTVAQLKILHSSDGVNRTIASLTETGAQIHTTDNEWAVLASYFRKQFQALFLAVELQNPTTKEAGTYSCELHSFQNKGVIVKTAVRTINTTASVASTQDIRDRPTILSELQDYYFFACNFENGLCGLKLASENANYSWTITQDRLMALPTDTRKPVHYPNEHYLFIEFEKGDSIYNKVCSVESQLIIPNGKPICYSFWYFHITDVYIYVYTNSSGILEHGYVDHHPSNPGWRQVTRQIPPSHDPITLIIEIYNHHRLPYAAIDDIVISNAFCNN